MKKVTKDIKQIEDTVLDTGLPVNSLAMLNRIKDILNNLKTNCLSEERARTDQRILKLMWLLNSQVFGQGAIINLYDQWYKWYKEEGVPSKEEEEAQEYKDFKRCSD